MFGARSCITCASYPAKQPASTRKSEDSMSSGSALKGFFGLIWRILDGIRKTLHLLLMLVIFGFILAALHTSNPIVPRSAALVIAPPGELVEQLSGASVRRALGEASGGPAPETLLKDVIDAITAAKADERIKLIVLDLDQLDASGMSKLQEIGNALRDFRTSGKRVIAMGDSYSQPQYYVAAQAGEIYLDPMGEVELHGFSYYRMYYKDAIDKLEVDSNVFKAGTFKSYTDQFSRSDMAPSEREETSVWLESLWSAYTQDVTRARSLPATALKDYISAQPASLQAVNGDLAKMAMQRGLVTALKSRRQVADDLKGLVGENEGNHSFSGIGMNDYLSAVRSKNVLHSKSDAKVGIVVASGEIFDGHRLPGSIGGESTSELLRQARFDSAIKAVVLGVASHAGGESAPGGYYIAAAANQIYASPTTITGSIGVFSYIPTFQRSLEKVGVKVDGLGTTPLAGDMRFDRALGAVTKQVLQASVDHAYQQFLHRVADGRKKTVEEIDKVAQGRVWAGADAQRIGLVDHLGYLKDATDAAAKLAELASDYDVDYIEPELSLRQELLRQIRSEGVQIGQLTGLIQERTDLARLLDPVLQQASIITRLKDPRGLYSYCWCREPSER